MGVLVLRIVMDVQLKVGGLLRMEWMFMIYLISRDLEKIKVNGFQHTIKWLAFMKFMIHFVSRLVVLNFNQDIKILSRKLVHVNNTYISYNINNLYILSI